MMIRFPLLLASVFLIGLAAAVYAADEQAVHPVEMGGNTCVYCHAADSTAENKSESLAHTEWMQSMHGLNNVGCATCHGDESDFRPASSIDNCLSCHPAETGVIKRKVAGDKDKIICVSCHPAHSFDVKKETKPVHK